MRSRTVVTSGAGGGVNSTANLARDFPAAHGCAVQSAGHCAQVSPASSSLSPQVAAGAAEAPATDSTETIRAEINSLRMSGPAPHVGVFGGRRSVGAGDFTPAPTQRRPPDVGQGSTTVQVQSAIGPALLPQLSTWQPKSAGVTADCPEQESKSIVNALPLGMLFPGE